MIKASLSQLFLACLLPLAPLLSFSLKDKFNAPSLRGSFIVTEYEKTTSFLRVYSVSPPYLFLEEINIPSQLRPKKLPHWDLWLQDKAPHHTSWLLYQIDLNLCTIVDCYSFSRQSYISLQKEHSFLAQLMTLPLQCISEENRKRIGSKSPSDELDMRKIWSPPKILHGKKIAHPTFQAMRATWPKDDSLLSGKLIDLYFDQDNPSFPFPYWIEMGDGHNVLKIRAIDSGYSLCFPLQGPPPKPPSIETVSVSPEGMTITLAHTSAEESFQIVLSSTHQKVHSSISLPHKVSSSGPDTLLTISQEVLATHLDLQTPTSYYLSVIPINTPSAMMDYPHPIRLPER